MFITLTPEQGKPFIIPEVGDEILSPTEDYLPAIVLDVQTRYDGDDNPVMAIIIAQ